MPLQPGRDRLRGAVGQHIWRPVGVDVDDDRGVHVPAASREIVHPHRGDLAQHTLGKRPDHA